MGGGDDDRKAGAAAGGAGQPQGRVMRVALWQAPPTAGQIGAALAGLARAWAAAEAAGAAVLVVPELLLPGYNVPDLAGDAAWLARLAAMAPPRCRLVIGWAEPGAAGLSNSASVIGPAGEEARYRKIQLYGPRERRLFTPGDRYCLFDLAGRRAALLICYDVEFAPHVAALAAAGAEVICVPTANMLPFTHVSRATVPAMAANHGVAVIYANYCGQEGDLTYAGGSLIAGPQGEVLAQAGETEALLIADLPPRDPARVSTQAADYRAVNRPAP